MELGAMLDNCLQQRCANLHEEAEQVIEDVSDRKIKASQFNLDPDDFVKSKLTSFEDAGKFERAAMCMQNCQLPIDIIKRIMNSNINDLQLNLNNCINSCKEIAKVDG